MQAQAQRQRVFSGIQPTGKLHIGNYIGALSLWAEYQDRYDNIFCIVDLHTLTIPEAVDPQRLHAKSRELAALYIACGIDPERSIIFVQSTVSAHAELAWILNCLTPTGWLERMTQYKIKAAQQESVSAGLLCYPVLQAADILLYGTHQVPVGEDQRQHVEVARDIALRFNRMFGEIFVVPEPLIRDSGARVMGLDDPTAKMSKSTGEVRSGHAVGLIDPPDAVQATIMRATTDSGNDARFESASPGVLNLLTLFEALSGEPRPQIEARFENQGYGFLKQTVAEQVIAALEPVRNRYRELTADPTYIEGILRRGTERAHELALTTLKRVKEQTGLG